MELCFPLPRHTGSTCKVCISYGEHVENHTCDPTHKELLVQVPDDLEDGVTAICSICDNRGMPMGESKTLVCSTPWEPKPKAKVEPKDEPKYDKSRKMSAVEVATPAIFQHAQYSPGKDADAA